MNKNSEDRTVINDLFCILSTLSLHYCGRFDFNFSVDSRGKTLTITISHYHLHQLKNIEIFTCSYLCEMSISYFYSQCMFITRSLLDKIYAAQGISILLQFELPFDS